MCLFVVVIVFVWFRFVLLFVVLRCLFGFAVACFYVGVVKLVIFLCLFCYWNAMLVGICVGCLIVGGLLVD